MDHRKLMLAFKVRGQSGTQVVGLARIRVDGRGALLLYDTNSAAPATIPIETLQSLSIWSTAPQMGAVS